MGKDKCCSQFNPVPWQEKEVKWQKEKFIKDRVTCFFYLPVNFSSKMTKNIKAMEMAGAMPADSEFVVLSKSDSMWGMDLYLKTTKEVPNIKTSEISGMFLTKVFEGPYKNIQTWVSEMKQYVVTKGKEMKDLLF